MKKCIFACSLVFFSMGAVAQSLTRGTPIPIKVVNTISSKDAGNSSFEVSDDVKASDGTVIIKHGTPVTVSVNSKRARGCGRPGSLDVKLVALNSILDLVGLFFYPLTIFGTRNSMNMVSHQIQTSRVGGLHRVLV